MTLNDTFLTQLRSFLTPQQILSDPENLKFYAQDWSNTLTPNASLVLLPQSTLEVSKILKICSEFNYSIVPSGGRTGLSGGAVATQGEIVLSLTKLNFIKDLNPLAHTLHVGAGAVTQAVHEYCKPNQLTWPVDFASKGSSTVGGNLSTNAGGIRVLRYGSTRNWVLGMTAVTMDGTIHHFNQSLEKNNTGVDFRHLLIGAEGTLTIITEAILKLAPLPKSRSVFMCNLKDFASVIHFYDELKKLLHKEHLPYLSAFECFDQACFEISTQHFKLAPPLSKQGSLFVIFELENIPQPQLEFLMEKIMEFPWILDATLAQNDSEFKKLWSIREGVAEAILHQGAAENMGVHQQDVSVPLHHLEPFYSKIQERYAQAFKGDQVFFFGHIGDGNIHIFVKMPKDELHSQAKKIDDDLFQILKDHEGSVSAEHGIGLLKKHALHYSRSPDEIKIMQGLKKIWDPKNLLNPHKTF